jgi:hypothetical protein
MADGGNGATRDTTPAGGRAAVSAAADSSAWAPLGRAAFRWLWLGVLISNMGIWMQTVGAQWLLVHGPNAAALVSLVQVASTLPVMLLALPAGVLADSFDRRWLLFTVQVYFFVVGIVLAVLTAVDRMPAVLLLALTFAMGVGVAVQFPGVAVDHPRAGAQVAVAGGGSVRCGRRQCGPCRRASVGRAGHRPFQRSFSVRPDCGVRGLLGGRPALVAPTDGWIGGPRAFRAGAAGRWPLHPA